MKNLITLVLAMILFSSCVTSQFHELIDYDDLPWWNFPYPPHLIANNNRNFRPSPELAKCFSDYKMVTRCLSEVFKKMSTIGSVSSECCAPIKTLYEDCEKTDFGSFRNPFFNYYVKKYCYPQIAPTPV